MGRRSVMLDAFRITIPDSLPTSPQSERGAVRSYAGSSQAVPDSRSSSPPRPSVLLAPARPPAAAARPSPVPTFAAPPRAPSTPATRPGSAGINDTFPADLLDAFKTPALPKKLKRLVTPPADDVAGAPG